MTTCSKLNTCYKIQMVLDKDLNFAELYAKAIRQVCAKCSEFVPQTLSCANIEND